MPSRNKNSSAGGKLYGPFQIGEGGHGKQIAREGCLALGAFPRNDIGLPYNPIPVDATDHIPPQYWGDIKIVETGLDGPLSLVPGGLGIFYMTTFDNFSTYELSCDAGTLWREDKIVYFRAPSEPGIARLNVEGREYLVTVLSTSLKQPQILSPDNHFEGGISSVSFQSSEAVIIGNPGILTHDSSDWEMSTTEDFSALFRHSYRSQQKTTWEVTGLNPNQDYYVRVRYNAVSGINKTSLWSAPLHISTNTPKAVVKPAITNPTNGQFGVESPLTITGSGFSVTGYSDTPDDLPFYTHVSSDWVIATNANFSDIVSVETQSTENKTSWTPTGLSPMILYFAKVRYSNSEHVSLWSDPVSFVLA